MLIVLTAFLFKIYIAINIAPPPIKLSARMHCGAFLKLTKGVYKMHIKAIVKTVFNWLQPEWYQTPDNNIDMSNQFENYVLTGELEESWQKLQAAKKLIAEYEYFKAAREEGLLITEREKQQRAEATYNLWLDCGFIQKGEIVPGVLEYLTDLINS